MLFLWLICSVRINEDVLVEVLIVEILESHCTSLECFLFLLFDGLLVSLGGQSKLVILCLLVEPLHFDAFLQEDGCGDLSVGEQFSEVLELSDSLEFRFDVLFGLHVGVTLTLVDRVANHFAALTPLVFEILLRIVILLIVIFIVHFVLYLVFLNLATLLILSFFATAPPEQCFGVILTPMNMATPVEV